LGVEDVHQSRPKSNAGEPQQSDLPTTTYSSRESLPFKSSPGAIARRAFLFGALAFFFLCAWTAWFAAEVGALERLARTLNRRFI
jgi:hypothetical protein